MNKLPVVLALNMGLTVLLIAAHATWVAPRVPPPLATLDLGELYRLKETQVTTTLARQDATQAQRAAALEAAGTFALELTQLLAALPQECGCVVLTRAAVAGPTGEMQDLTPAARKRLGL